MTDLTQPTLPTPIHHTGASRSRANAAFHTKLANAFEQCGETEKAALARTYAKKWADRAEKEATS